MIGINGLIPIYQIREVPKLHFYALDWLQAARLRKTLAVSGVGGLLSFDSQDSVRHPPVAVFRRILGRVRAGIGQSRRRH